MTKTPFSMPAATIETRGFILDEEADFALKDVGQALDVISEMIEGAGPNTEFCQHHLASLIRTMARATISIQSSAPFVNKVMAAPRKTKMH